MVLFARVAYALGALAALGLGVWQWPRIVGWLHWGVTPAPLPHFATLSESASSGDWLHRLAQPWTTQTPMFLMASTAALLTLVVFTAYVVWRED